MSKIVNVLRTLRNHWKKSTFGFLVVSYGVHYAKDKYDTNQMMRAYCEEAARYGESQLPPGSETRHITVILNPSANGGKGKTNFEKYCAPILYCSGMKVSVVKTEHIGEARGLMEHMTNTDAVVIAGGDGSLSETVTGLLRRPDAVQVSKQIPVGILPVGKTNSVARTLFKQSQGNDIKLMAEATMAVIRNVRGQVDVMKVEILGNENETPGKPVFGLGQVNWGPFSDVQDRIEKYWIWGRLKPYAAFVFGAFKDLTWTCNALLRYTLPCDGCKNCKSPISQQTVVQQPTSRRWWHAFLPVQRTPPSTGNEVLKDYSQIENPECGVWHERELLSGDFQLVTKNNANFSKSEDTEQLQALIGNPAYGTLDFVREGFARIGGKCSFQERLSVRQLELIPASGLYDSPEPNPETDEKSKQNQRFFFIDNDNYEVKPIRVTLLPAAITVFHPPANVTV